MKVEIELPATLAAKWVPGNKTAGIELYFGDSKVGMIPIPPGYGNFPDIPMAGAAVRNIVAGLLAEKLFGTPRCWSCGCSYKGEKCAWCGERPEPTEDDVLSGAVDR